MDQLLSGAAFGALGGGDPHAGGFLVAPEAERMIEELRLRGADPAAVDEALAIDERRRAAQAKADGLKAERNQLGPEIGKRKRAGEDATELLARASAISAEAVWIESWSSSLVVAPS